VTSEANLGAQALLDWLGAPTPPEPQPIAGATYASKIEKAEARIDWSRSAHEIERQAAGEWPGRIAQVDGAIPTEIGAIE